mmetsp:Transcript_133047/g.344310  ORF Transcript_133047/g.344310 Transcript_133047/m.344310 type:complete len:238 (-) Transcript_133047:228-941(-)
MSPWARVPSASHATPWMRSARTSTVSTRSTARSSASTARPASPVPRPPQPPQQSRTTTPPGLPDHLLTWARPAAPGASASRLPMPRDRWVPRFLHRTRRWARRRPAGWGGRCPGPPQHPGRPRRRRRGPARGPARRPRRGALSPPRQRSREPRRRGLSARIRKCMRPWLRCTQGLAPHQPAVLPAVAEVPPLQRGVSTTRMPCSTSPSPPWGPMALGLWTSTAELAATAHYGEHLQP